MKLTQRAVDALALPEGKGDAIYFDEGLPGFGIRLQGGSKTFVVQYKIGNQNRRISLGSTKLLKAEQARTKAAELLAKVRLGADPAHEKAEARVRAGETFSATVKNYLARQRARLRQSSYAAEERYLLKYFSAFDPLPLTRVDRRAVAASISEIATQRGPGAADRARSSLSGFLAWAVREGLIDANPVIATNTHLTSKGRDRVLSEAEIVEVWKAAGDGAYGTIVKLLILTGQRRDEIGALRWSEIDFPAKVIRLPAERVKNGRPHEVPLSEAALRLLESLPRLGAFAFGTAAQGFGSYSDAKAALDQRIASARLAAGADPMPPWVLHDLRRSAATHMAEIGIQPHIIEAILNHTSGHKGGIAGIYNKATYADEKRTALLRWADYVTALVEGRTSNVTALRA